MKNFLSTKKKSKILAAIIAGTCFSFSNSAAAMDEYNIDWEGKNLFKIQYYGEDDAELANGFFDDDDIPGLTWTMSDYLQSGLNKAFRWWAEIIGPGANISQPAQYFVGTNTDQNAGAASLSYQNGVEAKNPNLFYGIFQNAQEVDQFTDVSELSSLQDGDFSEFKNLGIGMIIIGQNLGVNRNDGNYGWISHTYSTYPVTPLVDTIDITPVMFHEIGHSLGITSSLDRYAGSVGDDSLYLGYYTDAISEKSFMAHLYNQDGVQAPLEKGLILRSENYLDLAKQYFEDKGIEFDFNTFYVPNISGSTRQGKMYLYFVGDNVTEVLDGKTFTRGDGEQVSGIPVNMWERVPEFSHLELARSMMSHQNYRSYLNFMEAELAVLQDIGYEIDRKNFYGRSIYNDGLTLTNTQGFSARENGDYVDGYNTSTLGIGLHVYGSNNDITQAANIYTAGDGAVGIRVDGLEDKITVAEGTEIHADGLDNAGVLIAYGRNHEVNINGTVTANGEMGNALQIDFGMNTLGAISEVRGSYIRYVREVSNEGQISDTQNLDLKKLANSNDDYSFTDLENGDLNAPMVDTVNINGTITAENPLGNAIYIGHGAFVKDININAGAQINGDIFSTWKQFDENSGFFSEETVIGEYETYEEDENGNIVTVTKPKFAQPLYIQYNGNNYSYNKYIPDLVTNLNFNSTMAYSGDISGAENIKLNVTGNNLVYGGDANVVNVNVAQGAGLFGGTFTVNDMTENLAEGFTDDTTGKFYNHGTISGVTINGDLISDGTLSGEAGKITVNGAANVDGSTVTSKNVLPDETAEILTAENISGNISNTVDNPEKVSGLLSGYGEISDNKITFTAKTANNIGNLNDQQNAAFNAVNNMSTALKNDDRKSELLPIYTLNEEGAGRALSQVGNNDAAQLLSAAQQSTVANRVISDRLATAFSTNTINFNAGGLNFADGDDSILMGVSANYNETADNNFWVKFTKNWGELKGGANYHGQAISGGYDRAIGKNWRGGLFVSYNATSLASDNSGGSAYDTRGGIYGGYHNDVDDAFIYIDAGKIRNKLNRSISALGLGAEAKYNSNIFEIGGEYKRNLTPEKIWAVSPFVNLQYSHLKQKAYNETGAGIFNQQVNSKSNGYFAGQLGVEFKRVLANGNYAARIGVKHAFTGANPELNFSYEGDSGNSYTLKNNQNKTHFVLSIGGENHFKGGWILGGDVGWQKGSHDRDLTASVMLRKVW